MKTGAILNAPTLIFDPTLSRQLDTLIIQLDAHPPKPVHTCLRLTKAELEQHVPAYGKAVQP